jgi:hypothetical protein
LPKSTAGDFATTATDSAQSLIKSRLAKNRVMALFLRVRFPHRPFAVWRRTLRIFHGLFYGLRNFCCKTVQFFATRRESEMVELPSASNGVQHGENQRKKSFLNYKSAVESLRKCDQ